MHQIRLVGPWKVGIRDSGRDCGACDSDTTQQIHDDDDTVRLPFIAANWLQSAYARTRLNDVADTATIVLTRRFNKPSNMDGVVDIGLVFEGLEGDDVSLALNDSLLQVIDAVAPMAEIGRPPVVCSIASAIKPHNEIAVQWPVSNPAHAGLLGPVILQICEEGDTPMPGGESAR